MQEFMKHYLLSYHYSFDRIYIFFFTRVFKNTWQPSKFELIFRATDVGPEHEGSFAAEIHFELSLQT